MPSVVSRTPTPASAPLSVVVASFRARAVLEGCIDALVPQCLDAGAELIVARSAALGDLDAIAAAHPTVRIVPVDVASDIPRLRGAGLAAAAGALVLLTEDHCVPAPDWLAILGAYADQPFDVVGGGMDNARRSRNIDWGAYFSEYGFFDAGGEGDGARALVTGANVAYARRIVGDVATWMMAGEWENVVHDRLAAAGARFHFEPAAKASQNLTYAFGPFVVDRFEHGRAYARRRLTEVGGSRWVRAATTPLLPAVLTWRVAKTAAATRERRRAFTRALPYTVAFLAAWAAGELTGYLRGPVR